MTDMLAVSRTEYDRLLGLARLGTAISVKQPDSDDSEIIEMIGALGREHYSTYGGWHYPEAVTISIPDSETDTEHAARVAKGLMNIGMSGPRHGGIPTITGDLMCEGAQIIKSLLQRLEDRP
jgi:hypothetical protein